MITKRLSQKIILISVIKFGYENSETALKSGAGKVTKFVIGADCFQIISISGFYYYF